MEELGLSLSDVLLLVDEFHELPGYSGTSHEEALADLRSLAGLLSKAPRGPHVIVTVSEGFAATSAALSALNGYSVGWLLVEHLDEQHFRALYEEYRGLAGCRLGLREIQALAGGAPGALGDLCPLSPCEVVEERIPAWTAILEQALSRARGALEASGARLGPREVIREALSVMEEPVAPLRDYERSVLAEALVEANVVYPKRGPRGGSATSPGTPYTRLYSAQGGSGEQRRLPPQTRPGSSLQEGA